MKRTLLVVAAALVIAAAWGGVAVAGEYHVSNTLICYDCHTMHFSMQHGWDGGTVSTTPTTDGNWLSTTGPNHYLLKMPVNALCKSCHDGQTFAPDVVEVNTNATYNRQAGATNEGGANYETWKGHTLDSTATAPGGSFAGPLECTNCHTQHGRADAYRNLGPRSFTVTYAITQTMPTPAQSKDVWINIDPASYTANTGSAATFGPYYAQENTFYMRNTTAVADNTIVRFCDTCHGDFHGAVGGAEIGGVGAPPEEFVRHPSSWVNIGDLGGGHSSLGQFTAATNKVKVATNDYTNYSNTTPICMSCHKAHGNQNPFGLIFMSRTSGTPDEQGTPYTAVSDGLRNLCGQCHRQGP